MLSTALSEAGRQCDPPVRVTLNNKKPVPPEAVLLLQRYKLSFSFGIASAN